MGGHATTRFMRWLGGAKLVGRSKAEKTAFCCWLPTRWLNNGTVCCGAGGSSWPFASVQGKRGFGSSRGISGHVTDIVNLARLTRTGFKRRLVNRCLNVKNRPARRYEKAGVPIMPSARPRVASISASIASPSVKTDGETFMYQRARSTLALTSSRRGIESACRPDRFGLGSDCCRTLAARTRGAT